MQLKLLQCQHKAIRVMAGIRAAGEVAATLFLLAGSFQIPSPKVDMITPYDLSHIWCVSMYSKKLKTS